MPNTQRILPSTIRRVVKSYIEKNQSYDLTIYPQGCYVVAHGTDELYPFIWLEVDQDSHSFEERYKAQHSMNENRKLRPEFVGHLSQQHMFRDPKNPQLYIVTHIPNDIPDEMLDRVVKERLAKFSGDDVKFNSRRTFIFV